MKILQRQQNYRLGGQNMPRTESIASWPRTLFTAIPIGRSIGVATYEAAELRSKLMTDLTESVSGGDTR